MMNIKRLFKKPLGMVAVFVAVGVLLVSVTSTAEATTYSGENVSIAIDQVVDGSLYATGSTITINGTIKGDVYCVGQNIIIEDAIIEGDVICAGQTIKIGGEVFGDVRVAAQTVTYSGIVDGNATTFGQAVTFDSAALVGRDINGATETLVVSGEIGRDVMVAAETARIDGIVGRNVEGDYTNLVVSGSARVNGSLFYTSQKDATIVAGSVAGEVVRTAPTGRSDHKSGNNTISKFTFAVSAFLAMLLVAFVVALVAPAALRAVTLNGIKRLPLSLLSGFFVLFAGPILVGLISATVVGIPLAIVLFALWSLTLLLSGPFFAFYLGRLILAKQSNNALLTMILGSTVLLLSYLVPVLNIFALLATATIGTGMIALEVGKRLKKPVYTVVND